MPNHLPQNLTVATTGASGAIFLRHFLLAVERDERIQTVNFIASDSALRVMAEELDLKGRSDLLAQILGSSNPGSPKKNSKSKIQIQSNADIGANVASGSYPADAMVVIPCSVGTLSLHDALPICAYAAGDDDHSIGGVRAAGYVGANIGVRLNLNLAL